MLTPGSDGTLGSVRSSTPWLALVLAACGAPPAAPSVTLAAPGVAPSDGSPVARLVLSLDSPDGDEAVRWVEGQLLRAGIEASSVALHGGEIVVEVDPSMAEAAEAAIPRAPEFAIAEVDEQWTDVALPSFARLDERTSWAGDPQRLRTIVAAPQDRERLASALRELSPRADRRFVVGKNLLTRDDPPGAHAVLMMDDTFVTGADIRDVEVAEEAVGLTVVYVTVDDDAAEALRRVTTGRSGFRIVLVLDDRVLMAPVITAPIADGRARIDPGDGRAESAAMLAEELRRSATPPPVRFVRREDPVDQLR